MCRLLGVVYGRETKREVIDTGEIAVKLFRALTHGGPHAYGWMQWAGGEIEMEKHPGRADTIEAQESILFGCGIYDRKTAVDKTRWFVGHVRYATTGSPQNNLNNHPLRHGNFIGVHNGVIRNYQRIIDQTGREDDRTEVDSEAIFAAVNKWGSIKGLRRINGDMVAIYADKRRPDRIRIARSDNRSLFFGWTTKGNLIFATEEAALLSLAPEIRFVSISPVSRNRLLVVKDAKVIERRSYLEGGSKGASAAISPTVSARAARRADFRGTSYAHRGMLDLPLRPIDPKLDFGADSLDDPFDLVEFDGIYVTPDEYEDLIRQEE